MVGFLFRKEPLKQKSLDEIKAVCNILFIDDHAFDVVKILMKAGWLNARRIEDVDSIDQKEIRDAHIIFVDIAGVGKKMRCKDEGLGLIIALKQKYPEKRIIVYSAFSDGDRFHKGLSIADERLNKNADPYEFQNLIENYSKELFSVTECAHRLQAIIRKELGNSPDVDEVVRKLNKLAGKKSFTQHDIEKYFFVAGNVADLVMKLVTLYISTNSTTSCTVPNP